MTAKYYNEDGSLRGFAKAESCLPTCIRKQVQQEICQKMAEVNGKPWSFPSTYNMKKNGKRKITDLEYGVLYQVMWKNGVDLSTGENIHYR